MILRSRIVKQARPLAVPRLLLHNSSATLAHLTRDGVPLCGESRCSHRLEGGRRYRTCEACEEARRQELRP